MSPSWLNWSGSHSSCLGMRHSTSSFELRSRDFNCHHAPLPHPGLPEGCLQTSPERTTTSSSATRFFPSSYVSWDSVPILQPCVPIPFCKLEKGRGLRACYVSGCNRCFSKGGTVVPRAMDDCEVCYIKTYLKEVQMNL